MRTHVHFSNKKQQQKNNMRTHFHFFKSKTKQQQKSSGTHVHFSNETTTKKFENTSPNTQHKLKKNSATLNNTQQQSKNLTNGSGFQLNFQNFWSKSTSSHTSKISDNSVVKPFFEYFNSDHICFKNTENTENKTEHSLSTRKLQNNKNIKQQIKHST